MSGAGRARRFAALVLAFAAAGAAASAAAEDGEEPFTPAEYAAAIAGTVSSFTVTAVLGPTETPLPLAVSNFLLDHPDLSAFVVNRHKIAPYRIVMLGPRRSRADDGEGTRGVVNLIEETEHHRLYYGEGVHRSRFFADIPASAVIAMDLSETGSAGSGPRTITTFHVWVRIKNRFVSGLVKTLRPFLQGTVVGKFSKAFYVADSVGRLMARDPDAVAADVRAFPGLFAEDRTALLAMIAALKPAPAAGSLSRP
ncbi:MAG: hypothetical protein ACHQ2Z_06310 [Elusimicrobiota bacterium]